MADEEFDAFVRTRYDRLCRVAFVLCRDWQRAEDLVQIALAKTYEAQRRRGVDDLDAYVRRVLVTTHATWWRRRWRGETPVADLPDTPARDDYGDADARATAVQALAALPAAQRAVLALLYIEDMSVDDAARVLGCPPGTIKSRAARALATLRADGALSSAPADLGG